MWTKQIEDIYFSFDGCGLICEQCEARAKFPRNRSWFSEGIDLCTLSGIREAFDFELSEEALKNFIKVVDKYMADRLEKKYCKLSFLRNFSEVIVHTQYS